MSNATLEPKQQRFAEEFLVDLNGTQAAIRAGYKPKSARSQASQLLTKPNIQEFLSEKRSRLMSKTDMTAERVLAEIARIAFSDPRRLFDEGGNLRDIATLDDETAACIASVEVEELFGGKGEDRVTIGRVKKIKLWNKTEGLNMAGKYFKLFGDVDAKRTSPLEELATEILLALRQKVAPKLVNG